MPVALVVPCILVSAWVGSTAPLQYVPPGQDPNLSAALGPQGGAATRGAFAPVLDGDRQPITKGGFVKNGPVIFEDVAEKAGLTTWRHTMGTPQKNYVLETTGSGVALLDYDNDGWLEIYLVNGSTFDALSGKVEPPHAALFITIMTGLLLTLPAKLVLRMTDGVLELQSVIMTTMDGRISMSPISARTGLITTITMEPSRM